MLEPIAKSKGPIKPTSPISNAVPKLLIFSPIFYFKKGLRNASDFLSTAAGFKKYSDCPNSNVKFP